MKDEEELSKKELLRLIEALTVSLEQALEEIEAQSVKLRAIQYILTKPNASVIQ